MSVITKVSQIANLTEDALIAVLKLQSEASFKMEAKLGVSEYDWYCLQTSDDETSDYRSLTADERKVRNYETAEACYMVYYGIASLKGISLGDVFSDKTSFGKGEMLPSSVEELELYAKSFYDRAERLISQYTSTGSIIVQSI